MTACRHCGSAVPADSAGGDSFCCLGCAGAHQLINGLGLGLYYQRRTLDPEQKPLRPDDDAPTVDYAAHASSEDDGEGGRLGVLHLMIEGMHCAACVWLIEAVLARQPGVVHGRVNMTTRRLVLKWREGFDPNSLVGSVTALGYRLVPYDPAHLASDSERQEKELLRAMAVAGFAAGNVMLLSVSVWAGHVQGMGAATRELMHWISALIVLPAVVYAGLPFFRSALTALRAGRTNMDVPISLGVTLACAMSVAETIRGGEHAYFDSAITLLFFLLIGRYLDQRARGRARNAGEHLLALQGGAATVIEPDGRRRLLPPRQLAAGMTVLVAAGERIAADGTVSDGESELDTSLISGETLPRPARAGDKAFAGTLNLGAPLRITVTAAGEATLLAEIVRLMEAAERGRARYVALADRVARYYAPVVHVMALATFLGWTVIGGLAWQPALLYAVAVLIITCPCALALAVPVVQVIAVGRLLRQGILVKSGTALERLAQVHAIVFDKTGTLTLGRPQPVDFEAVADADRRLAASLAGASKHPLARALSRAVPGAAVATGVREVAGKGLVLDSENGPVRLGSRAFCGVAEETGNEALGPELWLGKPGAAPVRFSFADRPRADAATVVRRLAERGYRLVLLSGDRAPVVKNIAAELGIEDARFGLDPAGKCAALAAMAAEGQRVAMVGDGLNDAPALAAAYVSLSPSTAVDVSQTAADVVFQGDRLEPVAEVLDVALRAEGLIKQNFALALVYNLVTVPAAVAGFVTPLVAAIAMSSSSILVIVNALRLARRRAAS